MVASETQRAIAAAMFRGDMRRAGEIAEAAIAAGELDAMLFSLAGLARQLAGDSAGANRLHARAVELAPEDAGVLAGAADALRYTGELADAVAMFDRALALDPLMVAAWYGRAQALEGSGAFADAAASYARVAELAPDTAPGHAGHAAMLARLGDVARARPIASRAAAIDPRGPAAQFALAHCDLAERRFAAAADRMRRLLDRDELRGDDRVVALGLLGDALDRLDAADEAFEAYSQANARFAEAHAGPNAPPVHLHMVESVDAALAAIDPAALSGPAPADDGEAARHIFLIGYPRSGTTLVEQVLLTAPGVDALEEGRALVTAEQEFLSAAGIAALATLPADEARRLRADYWRRVAAAGIAAPGRTLVDMDPFKGVDLPIIARLFPAAKVIVLRRDPRDVVWSCFRRNFVYSPVAYEFTSLQRAARNYDAVMRLTERCIATLPLAFHTLRYRDLVHDFDAETQRLCAFAGIEWTPAMRHFERTAIAGQGVKTASAHQVRRGLFDGTGQWRRYADKLEPVLPILQPWVEKFGFAA